MYHLVPVIVISDHFKYINMDISKENIIKLIMYMYILLLLVSDFMVELITK